jgi:hypothetical protein
VTHNTESHGINAAPITLEELARTLDGMPSVVPKTTLITEIQALRVSYIIGKPPQQIALSASCGGGA